MTIQANQGPSPVTSADNLNNNAIMLFIEAAVATINQGQMQINGAAQDSEFSTGQTSKQNELFTQIITTDTNNLNAASASGNQTKVQVAQAQLNVDTTNENNLFQADNTNISADSTTSSNAANMISQALSFAQSLLQSLASAFNVQIHT